MPHSLEYYLSRGFDRPTAEYYAAGRRRLTAVSANDDRTLTLTFDNGERRRFDCAPLFHEGSVFMKLLQNNRFADVYLDATHCVAWDIDPLVDSDVVWSNKLDLCPDSCYMNSDPVP